MFTDGALDLPYAEVLREILAILSRGDASGEQINHAIQLAKSINMHNHRGGSYPVYTE